MEKSCIAYRLAWTGKFSIATGGNIATLIRLATGCAGPQELQVTIVPSLLWIH